MALIRRKPLNRGTSVLRRSPLRAKPRRRPPMPPEVAATVLARDRWCIAHRMGFAGEVRCSGRPHIHHAVLRSQGGRDHPDDLLLLCEMHHHLAHNLMRTHAEDCGVIRRRAVSDAPDPGDSAV